MLTFAQMITLFDFDTKQKYCVEIAFRVTGNKRFSDCWMGKKWDQEAQKDTYWYGLTPDGGGAYDFDTFAEFADAPVFDGCSLAEVWDQLVVESIDGCDPMERIRAYESCSKESVWRE